MKRFEGKVALITGGTSGIGCAVAERLAKEGAEVIVSARNSERGKASIKRIMGQHISGNIEFFPCDVCQQEQIDKLYDHVCTKYGRVDVLFNNAGVLITCLLEEINQEQIDLVYKTNVEAAINMTRKFMPMLQDVKGNIINNASVAGMHSHTEGRKAYLYASSKAALIQFSKLCALNYAGTVRVNCICPGIIDTPIYTNRDYSRFTGIPMGRVGKAEEVANVVAFLASGEASYLTGLVMPIDGGSALV